MISPLSLPYFGLLWKTCFYLILMSIFQQLQYYVILFISTLIPGFLCSLIIPFIKVSLLYLLCDAVVATLSHISALSWLCQYEVLEADRRVEEEGLVPVGFLYLWSLLQHFFTLEATVLSCSSKWIHFATVLAEQALLQTSGTPAPAVWVSIYVTFPLNSEI